MPTVKKIKYSVELSPDISALLEEAEGRPTEDVLSDALTEVVRCKTHMEAKQILRGKNKRIPQTTENLKRAKKVREELFPDQLELPPSAFGVKDADIQRREELGKKITAKPRVPQHKQPPRVPEPEEIPEEEAPEQEQARLKRDEYRTALIKRWAQYNQGVNEYKKAVGEWEKKHEEYVRLCRAERSARGAWVAARKFKVKVSKQ